MANIAPRDPRPLTECLHRLVGEDQGLLEHLSSILPSLPCPDLWGRGLSQLFLPALTARLWDKVPDPLCWMAKPRPGGGGQCQGAGLRAGRGAPQVQAGAVSRGHRGAGSGRGGRRGSCVQAVQVVVSMKEERQESVLTSGLDLWEMDGCPLVAGERREEGSPWRQT